MLLINKKLRLKTAFLFLFVFSSSIGAIKAQAFDIEEEKRKAQASGFLVKATIFQSTTTTVTERKSVNGKLKSFKQIKSHSHNSKIISVINRPQSLTRHDFYAGAGLLTISSDIKSGSNEIKISLMGADKGQYVTLTLFNQPHYFQITQTAFSNQKKSTNSIIPINRGASAIHGKAHLSWSVSGATKRFNVYVGNIQLASFDTPNFPVKEVFIDNGGETVRAELQTVSNHNGQLLVTMDMAEAFSHNFIH
ncbi:hypothetical protein [Endozoicomonas sp. ALD040]|uniref:hypothetical protein n=1 Tax=unclassified Endozoicomonas TaxID=2644528 RepID=UPI003BB06519